MFGMKKYNKFIGVLQSVEDRATTLEVAQRSINEWMGVFQDRITGMDERIKRLEPKIVAADDLGRFKPTDPEKETQIERWDKSTLRTTDAVLIEEIKYLRLFEKIAILEGKVAALEKQNQELKEQHKEQNNEQ